jgi:hypothetical protein
MNPEILRACIQHCEELVQYLMDDRCESRELGEEEAEVSALLARRQVQSNIRKAKRELRKIEAKPPMFDCYTGYFV